MAIQIVESCQVEDLPLSRLASVLGQDPALSVKVLNVVNSASYGLPRQVATLDHAVSLLGMNTVQTLALSFSLMKSLRRGDTQSVNVSDYWRRSLIAGISSRLVGQYVKLHKHPEELFLA